jgi:hypothetical protein
LVRIRILEKKRALIPLEEAVGHMDEVVGLFLTGLSGFGARCGGRDLASRRAVDKPCPICASRYPKPRPSWRTNAVSR